MNIIWLNRIGLSFNFFGAILISSDIIGAKWFKKFENIIQELIEDMKNPLEFTRKFIYENREPLRDIVGAITTFLILYFFYLFYPILIPIYGRLPKIIISFYLVLYVVFIMFVISLNLIGSDVGDKIKLFSIKYRKRSRYFWMIIGIVLAIPFSPLLLIFLIYFVVIIILYLVCYILSIFSKGVLSFKEKIGSDNSLIAIGVLSLSFGFFLQLIATI